MQPTNTIENNNKICNKCRYADIKERSKKIIDFE